MIGTIYISGVIGVDTTLLDVIKQVKAQSKSESFLVKIDSVGGYVNEGNNIYNYLINLDKPVTTYAVKAFSIASIIFMAGSTRIVEEGSDKVLMIHLPWANAVGDSKKLEFHSKSLKAIEDSMIDFYSTALSIDKNTIHSLLENETYLNANQSVEMGFATQIQPILQAVALLQNNENKEEETLMNKFNQKIDSVMNMLSNLVTPKAELVLQDATGVSIIFPDLSGSDVPALEDKATVDGKPASGDFTMPDNSVFSFEKGVVAEIRPATQETETAEDTEEILAEETPKEEIPTQEAPDSDKDAMISELEAKVAELQAKLEELMTAAQAESLMSMLEKSVEKSNELEAKYVALAKQVGSDYQPQINQTKTSIKATSEPMSRAAQILNSKF